jgi:hypothetical protein
MSLSWDALRVRNTRAIAASLLAAFQAAPAAMIRARQTTMSSHSADERPLNIERNSCTCGSRKRAMFRNDELTCFIRNNVFSAVRLSHTQPFLKVTSTAKVIEGQ